MPNGILTLYADDSPRRPGNAPIEGDSNWTLKFKLSDGRYLHLHIGPATRNSFSDMILAEERDDVSGVIQGCLSCGEEVADRTSHVCVSCNSGPFCSDCWEMHAC